MVLRDVDVLLVGGGVASARCARTLRRRGFGGSILLLGDEPTPPYNRPPLSKELLRGEVADELVLAEPLAWYERRRVELRTGTRAVALRPDEHLAVTADDDRIRYRRCLVATGAEPRRPAVPGAERAALLRTIADAAAIRERAVSAGAGAAAVVIGGGFIGVEVAASLAGHGLGVTLLELSDALWGGALGEGMSTWARGALAAAGVAVRLATEATAIDATGVRVGDERLPAAIVVAGVGVRPRTGLVEGTSVPIDDGIVVDASRAAVADLFAAGDVARVPHPLAGRAIRVEHWHAAREGGEAAALGMLGEPVPVPRAPWVYSEFAGQLLDVVGSGIGPFEEVVLGEPSSGRFAVAHLTDGVVRQLAIVNGHFSTEAARSFVERAPSASELASLAGA